MTFIIPKSGINLRDPDTKQIIPSEGAEVLMTTFWLRRLRDGDVSIQEPKAKAPSKKADSPIKAEETT